jgi:23S rRNA (uracil1939-C5)-methyltransferase
MMVKKDQVVEVKCSGYTHDGLGVGRYEGFPIFIKGAVREQVLSVRVTKAKKNLAFARIEEVIVESNLSRVFECSVYHECGGCHIGHFSDEEQQHFKTDKVYNSFKKIAKQEIDVKSCLSMETPYRYRNKVAVPVKEINGVLKAGFYKPRSHDLIEFDDCLVQTKNSNRIIKQALQLFEKNKMSAYNEKSLKGLVRHIIIREAFITGEIMVCLVVTDDQSIREAFVNEFVEATKIDSLVLSVNKERTSVILGKKFVNLYGPGYITDSINEIKFKISANSFYQINQPQTEVLYNKAIEVAEFKGTETVLDAYCGIGSIGLNIASSVKKVVGIEVVEQAIEDAKKNALLNNITNIDFYAGDVSKVINELNEQFDAVIVDPPRKGCSTDFLDVIAKEMQVSKIVYISCDVATQARDVAYLRAFGYETNEVQPVDLFPHTHHVESVLVLTKN